MKQMHKRFTAEQVGVLLKGYCQGTLNRATIGEVLGIGKTRFFILLSEYRHNPDEFFLTYHRETRTRIPARLQRLKRS